MSSPHYLAALFEPDSVAVIGATERTGAIGSVLLDNMISAGFSGALYPVNPKYRWVRGRRCYRSVGELPQPTELAVVVSQDWQGHGLGRHLMSRLIDIARARGLKVMTGQILAMNKRMLGMAKTLGFVLGDDEEEEDHTIKHVQLAL